MKDIKRTLDAMSMSKLNVFHWHVVDSQSFPLEIPGFPELARKGAYSSQDIYTTADVQDIVKYATEVCVVLCLPVLLTACSCDREALTFLWYAT